LGDISNTGNSRPVIIGSWGAEGSWGIGPKSYSGNYDVQIGNVTASATDWAASQVTKLWCTFFGGTADSAVAADRARKLSTARIIGKSTTFDGTANIVPDSSLDAPMWAGRTWGTSVALADSAKKSYPTSAASGDLSGSYPGPTVAKIKNNTVPVNANGSLINNGSGNLSWAWPTYTNVGADQSGAGTAAANAAVSGTSGDFAKFTGTHTIGNSSFMSENGTGVGIGSMSPSAPLTVQTLSTGEKAIDIIGRPSDSYGIIRFYNSNYTTFNSYLEGGSLGVTLGSALASPVLFVTNGSERARIDQNGYVGIGTASPDSQLTVSAGAHIGGGLLVGGATTINNNVTVNNNSNPSYYMTMTGGTGVEYITSTTGLSLQGYNSYNFNIGNNYASTYQMNATGMNCYGACTTSVLNTSSINSPTGLISTGLNTMLMPQGVNTRSLRLTGLGYGSGVGEQDTVYGPTSSAPLQIDLTYGSWPCYVVNPSVNTKITFTNIGSGGTMCYPFRIINIASSAITDTVYTNSGHIQLQGGYSARLVAYNNGVYWEY
jgi:hypothetical protein